jgi:general secretion pathway protein K
MKPNGIALVTALLVVAIASLAATALMSSTQISLHRTAALQSSEQAWWVARGVESWVLGILKKDAEDSQYDGFDEAWAQPVDYLPVDQGFVRGGIADLQGRFNLNDLAPASAGTAPPQQSPSRAQFKRLLQNVPELQASPDDLIAAIIDWMDPDQSPSFPGGAEDSAYMSLDPPYRAANRQFTVPSELLAIHGLTPKIYETLAPLVTALPATGQPINVNTAPEMVLRALGVSDEGKLRQFLERRKDKPAKTKGEFEAEYTGMFEAGTNYGVASSWFQIHGEVVVGSSRVGLYSLIYRDGSNAAPVVLAHSADAD